MLAFHSTANLNTCVHDFDFAIDSVSEDVRHLYKEYWIFNALVACFILPGYALDERKDPALALEEKVTVFIDLLKRERSIVSGKTMDDQYWKERGVDNSRMIASFIVPHFFLAMLSSSSDMSS